MYSSSKRCVIRRKTRLEIVVEDKQIRIESPGRLNAKRTAGVWVRRPLEVISAEKSTQVSKQAERM